MRRYFPEQFVNEGPINTLCLGSQTGDGLAMAEEIGLEFGEDMDAGVIGPGHHPWSHSLHEAVHRPETLWVNKNGERFTNESLSVMAGWALLQQPESSLWALFDSSTLGPYRGQPEPAADSHGRPGLAQDPAPQDLRDRGRLDAADGGHRRFVGGAGRQDRRADGGAARHRRPLQRPVRPGPRRRLRQAGRAPAAAAAPRRSTRCWACASATAPRAAPRSTRTWA